MLFLLKLSLSLVQHLAVDVTIIFLHHLSVLVLLSKLLFKGVAHQFFLSFDFQLFLTFLLHVALEVVVCDLTPLVHSHLARHRLNFIHFLKRRHFATLSVFVARFLLAQFYSNIGEVLACHVVT